MLTVNLQNPAIHKYLISLLILGGALILSLWLKRAFHLLAPHLGVPPLAFKPVRLLIRYAVLALAAVLVLKTFGFDMLNALTALFAMVAIGFVAVWSILSNFLCTICLVLMKPFSVGDEVEFPGDGIKGTVVDLTMSFTLLSGEQGEFYQVPNNMFFQKIVKRKAGAQAMDLKHQLWRSQPVERKG